MGKTISTVIFGSSDVRDSRVDNVKKQKQKDISFRKPDSKLTFVEINEDDFIPPAEDGQPIGLYVDGLSFHWDGPKFEKFLKNKCNILFTRCSKKKGGGRKGGFHGIIYFENNDDRLKAYRTLQSVRLGDKRLFVVPLHKSIHLSENLARRVRARFMNPTLATSDIRDRVTPWHHMPIEEQHARKSEKYTDLIKDIIPGDSEPLSILMADNCYNYRNKVEMTVGHDLNGEIVVGFNKGSKDEDVIAPIHECFNVPVAAPEIADLFTEFVKKANSPIYDRIANRGVWKFICVRTTVNNDVMLVVVTYGHPADEDIKRLNELFSSKVQSLWLIETKNFEGYGKDPVLVHLSGSPVIKESLRGLHFDISPLSFFQTNTPAAEVLFAEIEELASVNKKTVLIDVCCGTGVIGLSLAKKAKKVIGIDIEESAIKDAIRNAEDNNIKNAEFIAGPAEKVLTKVLEEYEQGGDRVVVIVDPPREGLRKEARNSIRRSSLLKRLVYVSCNPQSLVRDASECLTKESGFNTKPFVPTKWFGVDLFPHTDRLELVMLMERE